MFQNLMRAPVIPVLYTGTWGFGNFFPALPARSILPRSRRRTLSSVHFNPITDAAGPTS